eukprot:gene684-574_t
MPVSFPGQSSHLLADSYFYQQFQIIATDLNYVDLAIGVFLAGLVFLSMVLFMTAFTQALQSSAQYRMALSGVLMSPEIQEKAIHPMLEAMKIGFSHPEVRDTMIGMMREMIQDPAFFGVVRDGVVGALRDTELTDAIRDSMKEFLKDPALHKAIAQGATQNLIPTWLQPNSLTGKKAEKKKREGEAAHGDEGGPSKETSQSSRDGGAANSQPLPGSRRESNASAPPDSLRVEATHEQLVLGAVKSAASSHVAAASPATMSSGITSVGEPKSAQQASAKSSGFGYIAKQLKKGVQNFGSNDGDSARRGSDQLKSQNSDELLPGGNSTKSISCPKEIVRPTPSPPPPLPDRDEEESVFSALQVGGSRLLSMFDPEGNASDHPPQEWQPPNQGES